MTRAVATSAVTIACAIGLLLSGCRDRSPAPAEQSTISAAPPAPVSPPSKQLALPMKAGSVRFAAIGDAGRGDAAQYAVSAQMQAYRREFPYTFVVMLGDNVYDGGTPEDYRLKFEQPYQPLLDAGVTFYATIGNHDDPNQPSYAPFHMEGRRYYTFTPPALAVTRPLGSNVRFFMIDTERLDREELAWIDREMEKSDEDWKIPIFHRPIYTSGRYARPRDGSAPRSNRFSSRTACRSRSRDTSTSTSASSRSRGSPTSSRAAPARCAPATSGRRRSPTSASIAAPTSC